MQRRMLFSTQGKWYLSLGTCPGLCYATRLINIHILICYQNNKMSNFQIPIQMLRKKKALQIEEIALEFKGPLPECLVDEHRIPSHDDENNMKDVLKENEAVRCLQVLPQPKPDCNLNNINTDCCLIRKTYYMIQTSLYATLGHIPGKPSCGCCCWQRRQAFYRFPKPKYLLIYIYIY